MIEFTEEDDAAVKWCEDKYPELAAEYKKQNNPQGKKGLLLQI